VTPLDCQLIERLPTIAEHRAMFKAVGWTLYAPAAAEISLRNSLFSVVVERAGTVIGMGRIIGDGGKFFYIQDVAVLPQLQGQGIGTLIMDRLIGWIETHAPHEPFVGLFSTQVEQEFYRRYGFDERRAVLSGMWTVLPVDNTGK
jgi:GNAT superfamily N-acetyltransferase